MNIAKMYLVGAGPYSQSKHYTKDEVPPKKEESNDAYERRTWRNRMHVGPTGHVEIPGASFASCVKGACKRLQMKVPDKKGALYTKYFDAGIMVPENLVLPIKPEDVAGEELFVPSDGRPGGGSRVPKVFSRIDAWEGVVTFYIFDDIIKEDVFMKALISGGQLVGIGRFRPENRGFYGRFIVDRARSKWMEDADVAGVAA